MSKIVSLETCADLVEDGMTIMFGGFLGCGTPNRMIDAIIEKNTQNISLIANDTATPTTGVGKLVVNKQLRKATVSHIGTNPETGRQMVEGELEVELVPQGSLSEKIRCGGAGLGGVLTLTGVGTVVEEGKQVVNVNGKTFLLEEALRADIAIIKGHKADRHGNIVYSKSARNQNPLIATAGKIVIAEVDEVVEVGELDPETIVTPGVFVDYVVKA